MEFPSYTHDSFTFISKESRQSIARDYEREYSQPDIDADIQITKSLRQHYPELCVVGVPEYNAPLLAFAAAGYASYELDNNTETVYRWRGYVGPSHRGGSGQLGDSVFFAKYRYEWAGEHFIVYTAGGIQYVLKEPDTSKDEHVLSHCSAVDALVKACALATAGNETDYIYVYDDWWTRSRSLYEEVQKASWDNVILDPKTKKALKSVTKNFFDSKDVYRKYGVPWKRGVIFYGPPGNGKTVSVKALMHELQDRENPIPTLYVKNAPSNYDIGQVFSFARTFSPCLLVMEDIETIVNQDTRSYFFNEVDGIENNDGIMMIATTNYVERLDPGISSRPSRFDRKYDFPLPNKSERTQYAEYWRKRIAKSSPEIGFPKEMCSAVAEITNEFSFAYIQELFIASLLMLARDDQDEDEDEDEAEDDRGGLTKMTVHSDGASAGESAGSDSDDVFRPNKFWAAKENKVEDPLDKYRLWRAIKVNEKILRDDLKRIRDGGDDNDSDDNHRHGGCSAGTLGGAKSRSTHRQSSSTLSRTPHSRIPPSRRPREQLIRQDANQASSEHTKRPQLGPRTYRGFQAAFEDSLSLNAIRERTFPGRTSARAQVPSLAARQAAQHFYNVPRFPGDEAFRIGGQRQDPEPSNAEMAGAGVGKVREFADGAFKWTGY